MENTLEPLGAKLIALCSDAEQELVLIAPFIKVQIFKRLLSEVSPGVRITCVTRWRPEEVAVGVTDLEIFDEVCRRDRTSLLLLPQLHAKYFRADERCLIGSANLTGRALGWRIPSNIELLVEESFDFPGLVEFENNAVNDASSATEEHRRLVADAASRIISSNAIVVATGGSAGPMDAEESPLVVAAHEQSSEQHWLPSLRQPQDLYLAYTGRTDQLSIASRVAASNDIGAIDPVMGLDQPSFEATVAATLLQMPMISAIDQALDEPQRFGALRDLIAKKSGISNNEAVFTWQTTMRWLMFFLPGRYERTVPSYSEIFARTAKTNAPAE